MSRRDPTEINALITAGRAWRFTLPLTRPLSLNDRRHWRVKAREVSAVRHVVKALAHTTGIPKCTRITVELHYAPRDRRRRDADNLVATLKPVHDGIVDAGIIPDDTDEYLDPTFPVIDPPTGGRYGALHVVVIDISAAP